MLKLSPGRRYSAAGAATTTRRECSGDSRPGIPRSNGPRANWAAPAAQAVAMQNPPPTSDGKCHAKEDECRPHQRRIDRCRGGNSRRRRSGVTSTNERPSASATVEWPLGIRAPGGRVLLPGGASGSSETRSSRRACQRHGNGGGQVEPSPNRAESHEQYADENERHERNGRKHGIARIDRWAAQSDAALDRAHVGASAGGRPRADQAERHCPCSGGQTEDGEREPSVSTRRRECSVSVANGLPRHLTRPKAGRTDPKGQ